MVLNTYFLDAGSHFSPFTHPPIFILCHPLVTLFGNMLHILLQTRGGGTQVGRNMFLLSTWSHPHSEPVMLIDLMCTRYKGNQFGAGGWGWNSRNEIFKIASDAFSIVLEWVPWSRLPFPPLPSCISCDTVCTTLKHSKQWPWRKRESWSTNPPKICFIYESPKKVIFKIYFLQDSAEVSHNVETVA